MKENIPYITLTWKSTPRSDEDIFKFEAVTGIIKNKDSGLYLALEFIREEYWLIWWKLEEWEKRNDAIVREVEEESGYKNAKIISILFEQFYSRWYKARKDREEECLDKVYLIEVEEKNKSKILWADIWTEWVFWLDEKQMLNKLTLDHHLYYFKEYLRNK